MKIRPVTARVLVQMEDGLPIEVGTIAFTPDLTAGTLTASPTGGLRERLADAFADIATDLRDTSS